VNLAVTVANRSRRALHLALPADATDGRGHYGFAVSSDHPAPGVHARRPDWADRAMPPIAAGEVATRYLAFAVDPTSPVAEIVVAPVIVGRSGSITAVLPDHVTYTLRR
jgi:hypothetical protein